MKPSVLLAGREIAPLAAIVAVLDPRSVATHLVATPRALRHLATASLPRVDVVVMMLDGSENVAEMRTILECHEATRFIFLAPSYPPAPAMARVCSQYGGTVYPVDEEPVVLAAGVVAMLALRSPSTSSGRVEAAS
jgi:hypothetical protein